MEVYIPLEPAWRCFYSPDSYSWRWLSLLWGNASFASLNQPSCLFSIIASCAISRCPVSTRNVRAFNCIISTNKQRSIYAIYAVYAVACALSAHKLLVASMYSEPTIFSLPFLLPETCRRLWKPCSCCCLPSVVGPCTWKCCQNTLRLRMGSLGRQEGNLVSLPRGDGFIRVAATKKAMPAHRPHRPHIKPEYGILCGAVPCHSKCREKKREHRTTSPPQVPLFLVAHFPHHSVMGDHHSYICMYIYIYVCVYMDV
jgi:hypothetical protein